jgi:hypothetical protein
VPRVPSLAVAADGGGARDLPEALHDEPADLQLRQLSTVG